MRGASLHSHWRRLKWSRRAARRNIVTLVIAASAALLSGFLQVQESNALYPGGPLHAMESAAQDAVLRSRNPERYGTSVGRSPRDLMTIVAIDERSLAELGVFRNWPRSYYAQVIDQLMTAAPRVIVLDVGFFEPSPEDSQLAAALERARAQRPTTALVLAAAGGGDATRGSDGAVEYGTSICISQSTLDAANHDDAFMVRHLDLVAVKGKRQAVPVFELIGWADDAALAGRYSRLLDLYGHGMVLYHAQHFAAATELFAEAARATGDGLDAPSALYIQRCRELAVAPPGANWDRVYVMKHK